MDNDDVCNSLANAEHHLALAGQYRERMLHYFNLSEEHRAKADHYLRIYRAALAGDPFSDAVQAPSRSVPNCVYLWQDWLRNFGPHLRSEVAENVGVKFNERATPYTLKWSDTMAELDDAAYPQDQIVKMFVNRDKRGRGGLPTAYFLWSQRDAALAKFPDRPKQ